MTTTLGATSNAPTIGLVGSIAANKLVITGVTAGFPNGTEVSILIQDIRGTSTSVIAVIQGNSFVLANIDTTQFTAGNLTLTATAGNALTQSTVLLVDILQGDPIVIDPQPALNGLNQLTIQGRAPSLQPNEVLTLEMRDTVGAKVTATAVVQADGSFSVQDMSTQGLRAGLLVIDVKALTSNGAVSVVNAANLVLGNLTPEGTDATLSASEDTPLAVTAADFGYNATGGYLMTGVKIAGLPAQGTLKLNGVAVVMDQFVTVAQLNAGQLVFQAAANASGTNYANFKFKVMDSRSGNNEDLVANTLTFNVAAVNDPTVVANLIPDQVATYNAPFSYTVPANTFSDVDSTLTYSATLGSDAALPAWLTFNAATRTFSGTPPNAADINLKVIASDGTNSVSDVFRVAIAPAVTSLAVVSATGALNDRLSAGDVATIEVNFIEAVTVTGTPQLALNIGGTLVQANYVSGSGSTTLTFTYTVQAGQNDANGISINANALTLNGGTIKDVHSNNAILNTPAVADNASFKVDTENLRTVSADGMDKNFSLADDTSNTWAVYSDGTTKGRNLYVTVAGTEALQKAQMRLDGGAWTDMTLSGNKAVFHFDTALATGAHAFDFRTQDLAGNFSAVTTQNMAVSSWSSLPTVTTVTAATVNVPNASTGQALLGNGSLQTFTVSKEAIGSYLNNGAANLFLQGGTTGDAGSGTVVDHLTLTGDGAVLNLSDLLSGGYTVDKVQGFEFLDMRASGKQAIVADAISLGSVSTSGWLSNSNLLPGYYAMVVRGGTDDTLVINKGGAHDFTGFVAAGTSTNAGNFIVDGITYDIYRNDTTKQYLLVQQGVQVSIWRPSVVGAPVNIVPLSVTALQETTKAITDISVEDINGNLSKVQLTVLNGTVSVTLSGTTVSAGALNSSSVTLTGTQAQLNEALATLTYKGDAAFSGTDTLTIVSTDSTGTPLSDNDTVNITVSRVNNAPVNTVPGAQSTAEDTDKVITGLSVSDADGNANLTVTLSITNGTLTLLNGAGVTLGGNNSTSVTLTGAVGDINALLAAANAVTYKPTPDFFGNATLTMTSSDGTLTDIDSVAITVAAVNDAPVLADSNLNLATVDPVTGNPMGAVGSLVSSFMGGVSDVDAGALQGMAITGVDTTKGTVWFSTNGGSAWTEVTQTLSNTNALLIGSDADNRLYFKPTAGAPDGQVSAAISFRAWDRTTGTEGSFVSTTLNGGTTAFSTGVETIAQTIYHDEPPTLVGSNPSDNGFMMAVSNNITLNFSEAIVKGTGLIELYKADGSLVQSFDAATSTALTWSGSTLTINPTADLLANTGYYIKIAPTAVKDTTGNAYAGIADVTTLNFTTANGDGSIPLTPTYPGESNSRLGISVSNLGDVNGDGFDDVIVGASGGNGAAYVIYGNASGAGVSLTSGTIAADEGFKIVGPSASSYTGDSVSSMGDINGDGLADILVGAYHGAGTTADGAAYVVFGSTQGTTVNLSAFNASQGFKIVGPERLGFSVSNAGDVNGDGINDMIAGALPGTGTGTAYVIYGKTSGMNFNFVDNSTLDPSDGFRLMGTTASGGANLGFTVSSAGDFNGDGYADVIVGADGQWDAYIIFGGPTGFGGGDVISLAAAGKGIKLNGDVLRMGHQVAGIGDHNGDGLSDIVMVANTGSTAYHVNVIYGTSDASVRNISMSDLPTNPSLGYRITSNYVASSLTRVSGAGDMNGDGIADLVISGYAAITYSGWSYVVYGTSNVANNLDNLGRLDLSGQSIDPSLGFRVVNNAMGESISTAGDFNGDGLDDLIFGSIAGRYSILLGGTQWVTQAVQGAGVITGMAEDEALIGSAVDDILTGGGGVDRFFAVAGNDTIVLTASDVANLASNSAASVKAMVDGGTGYDTIRLAGGANLDLTQITNVGAMGTEERSRIESIERIDLATDTAANKLTISSRDIKDMAGFNRIHTGLASEDGQIWTNVSGAALSTTTRYHQMVVEATAADSVVLTADLGGWLNAGTVSNGTSTYNVFQNDRSNTQIIVSQGAAVNLPPNLVGSTPSDNGFMTALGNDLVLNFSETVVKGTGLIELFNANGTLVQSFDVVSSGLVTGWGTANLTINPTNNLSANTGYYIKIAPTAVKDTTGNAYAGITDSTTLNFTTADASGAIVVPVNGVTAIEDLSTIGDFNGDGYDDFIVGAGMNGLGSTDGAAFVVYGNANGTVPNLSGGTIAANAGFKIVSGLTGDYFGIAVNSAGDTNGDGLADLVVTAKYGDTSYRESAYVVFGKSNASTVFATGLNVGTGLTASMGYQIKLDEAYWGQAVSNAGDVNGDGLSDLLVISDTSAARNVYVIYGKTETQPITLTSYTQFTPDMGYNVLTSNVIDLGQSVYGAGDVNGDGLADFIVGAPNSSTGARGMAYVVYGNSTGTSVQLNATNGIAASQGFRILGDTGNNSSYSRFGFAVSSAGDVNGDGLADVMISSPYQPGVVGGAVYVVYGNSSGNVLDIDLPSSSGVIAASRGFQISSALAGDHLGPYGKDIASAGDINGDGLSDMIISGRDDNGNTTASTYVVYGNASGTNVAIDASGNIAASNGFKLKGAVGFAVASAGDINGDGLNDLLVSARLSGVSGSYNVVLGGTQWVTAALDGAGTFAGTSGSEALIGSAGNDTITGGGGVDRFFAGKGDDTIVLTASDIANLQNNSTGQTAKASVSAGTGFDTIRLSGGAGLDLLKVSNAAAMGIDETSRIEGIERIDMATDTAANTLKISNKDINDMAGFNQIHTGSASADGKSWTNVSGSALSNITSNHQMVVDGGSTDTVALTANGGAWATVGTVSNGTTQYTVYQNTATKSQLLVQQGVSVDTQAPTLLWSTPADNDFVLTANLGNNITLQFSEAVVKGNGYIQLWNKTTGQPVEAFDVNSSTLVTGWGTSTLTINPTANLAAKTDYFIKVSDNAIQDNAGLAYSGLNSDLPLNFSTQSADGSFAVTSSFTSASDTGAYLRSVASAGDFNGDGYDDLLIGAAGSSEAGVYVIYGNAQGEGLNLDKDPIMSNGVIAADQGFKIHGRDYFGTSVSGIGDVNGDGLADLLVTSSGNTFVIYGSSNAAYTGVNLSSASPSIASSLGFQIATGGYVVSGAGDVNGDGFSDLITGDASGNIKVIYGAASGVTPSVTGFSITAQTGTDTLAKYALSSAGDVNGDGYADIIVGNYINSKTFVIYGNSSSGQSLNLSTGNPVPSAGFTISYASGTPEHLGYQVSSAGDVNGDGLADLLVAVGTNNINSSSVYVVYGNANGTNVSITPGSIASSNGFAISGPTNVKFGLFASSAGDVNGDGLADVIVSGRSFGDPGFAYVVYGNASGTAVSVTGGTIAASLGFKVTGPATGLFATNVSNAGDINGDGLADLVVGGYGSGSTFSVILGGTQWVSNAVSGSGTVTGTTAAEAIIGSANADVLAGGGGVDRFFAGMGNDTIVLTASDVTNLANNATGQTAKATVSGGNGFDTIRLSGSANLNLSSISNVGGMGLEENSRIESIERIDLATDGTANTLVLAAKDVKDMAGFNLFRTGTVSADGRTWTNLNGGTALGASTAFHQVLVDGGNTDSLVLNTHAGTWTNAGTVSNGTNNYTVYQNTATATQVLVQAGLSVVNTPVMLAASTPVANGYQTALGNNLTLTFDQAVLQGTGTIQLFNSATGALVEGFDVGSSTLVTGWGTSTLTINPTADLTASTGYYLKVTDNAVQNAVGSTFAGIADSTTYRFSTAAANGSVSASIMAGPASSYMGWSVSSAGDVNGDGIGDFIVGSPQEVASTNGPQGGAAYVVYGNTSGAFPRLGGGTIAASAGFKISSADPSNYVGYDVTGIGDINGDGMDDVLVGLGGIGAVYVLYGNSTGTGASIAYNGSGPGALTATAGGFAILGPTAGNGYFGYSVSGVGDLNADGFSDFIVNSAGTSSAFVIYGGTQNGQTLNISDGTIAAARGYKIATLGSSSLNTVSGAGDVNGDGFADLIVADDGDSTATMSSDRAGRAFVIYSNAAGTVPSDLNNITGTQGFKITGFASNGASGFSRVSSLGDVNGDGLGDVGVITANRLYVVFGNATGAAVDLSNFTSAQGFTFETNPAGRFTSVSSAGDVNGDGLNDILVGDGDFGNNQVFVVYGKSSGAAITTGTYGTFTMAAADGFRIAGSANTQLGWGVSNAGDVNGDGLADLIVGAPQTSSFAGGYSVILGGTQWVTSAVSGSGAVTGTASAEAVIGSAAADTLTGGGGVDRFYAGFGNDTVVLTASDVTNMANNTAGGPKALVNGGGGFDTIRLSGGAALNLTTIRNTGAMGLEENSRIESIERIDLATDTAANTLTLMGRDVKDMAGFNLIRTGTASADGRTWINASGSALGSTTAFHQLVVDGSSSDALVLSPDTGFWTSAGTVNNGTDNYTVYQNVGTNSQVLVKSVVVVTNNDSVAPLVFDLNRDGVLSYGQVTMDVNGDGHLDLTAWAGAQDGVLVWDKFADGLVHGNSQYAFAQYATTYANGLDAQGKAPTDLSGLAEAFDSNHDGMFNAQDAKFAEFKVWQDANQNGVSDAGEVRSLADLGMASINLVSDGVVRTPAAGVTEAGQTTASSADGSSMLVADAAFAFSSLNYSLSPVTGLPAASDSADRSVLTLLGAEMNVDLSRFVAQHGAVSSADLSGTGANRLKISLQDVLQGGASGSLTVKGNADDTALLNASEWMNTGDVVSSQGHSYAVYSASHGGAAQLLLDQQMSVHAG